MQRRSVSVLMLLVFTTCGLWAQGINTAASPNDWEEINFDFNSSVLVDGFPSLLRLAELLRLNEGYRVRVEGYTDALGASPYNQNLGMARANTVRDFLLKYGARNNQIATATLGETAPRATPQGQTFQRTDEARYMNRRVVITVTDAQGNTVSAGGAGDAIRAINAAQAAQAGAAAQSAECCQNVLRRLDQLDDIARMLKDLADQNAALRRDLDALRAAQQAAAQGQQALQQGQQAIDARLNQPPPQPPKPPSADEVAAAVQARLLAERLPSFQLLGLNVGSDADRNVTFSGRGRYFKPFGDHFGVQAQAEYYYLRGQREGQFDIGLVDRFGTRVQAGLFASFKNVSLSGAQHSGTLGQGSFVLDYLFSRGKIGLFASKGFKTQALINRANGRDVLGNLQNNIILERYLSVVDQVGVGTTLGLMGNVYAEGNLAYLRSTASSNRAGGSLRLVFPVNDKFAFTVEGGVNETLLPVQGTQQGRAAVGFQLGNFIRPKNILDATHAVPMEIPRVRYETLTKRVRTGNDLPIADAGPDRSNVPAGLVTLDGSNSYDPDGDPITYQWVQESGQAVALSSPSAAVTSFTAVLGQAYSFRLVVRDNQGGQGIARVGVTTTQSDRTQVLFFIADPRQISAGQQTTLSWKTLFANTVSISGVGPVASQGSVTVSPTSTTTYTLTATSGLNTETSQVTVVVAGANFVSCFATPATFNQGQSTTLNWTTQGATSVSISPGVGVVGQSGSVSVSPTQNTTYTLIASGQGSTNTCTVSVTVIPALPPLAPVIAQFTASPTTINQGQSSSLAWNVTGATSVSITGLGTVQPQGSQSVSPAATTTYVLTATNSAGASTAQVTVNVNPPTPLPVIVQFSAAPATINPGQSSTLSWNVTGATSVSITNLGTVQAQGTQGVSPLASTTYVLTATNNSGSATAQTTVTVNPPSPLPIIAQFSASPAAIGQGQSSTLTWNVTGATSVSITNLGTVQAQGTQGVSPLVSTTYVLTATNTSGSATAQTTVTVNPPSVPLPIIAQFSASPATIDQGQSSTLTWNVTGATSVTITNLGTVQAQGTQNVSPSTSTTYILTATNSAGGSVTAQAVVNVNIITAPLIVQFDAIPQELPSDGSLNSRLVCSTVGAASITIAGTTFTNINTAVLMVSPRVSTTYSCVATNLAGQTDSRFVTVFVTP